MITLITGVPGSGKTLYCVSEILPSLIGSVVPGQDGNPDITRTVYTNINGLLLDHENIDGGLNGLQGWQNWCKPGDCIVFDEVQSVWKPRPNGSKIPDDIGALETHRHKGVDFVLLTQHPMLLDQNVRALIGRHLHIRRMGGMGAAIVYEWDSCSRSLTYSNSITRKPWRYSKKAFKQYKSAELHTKQTKSLPLLLWFAIIAFLAAMYFVPSAYDRLFNKDENASKAEKEAQELKVQPPGMVDKSAPGGSVQRVMHPAPVRAAPDTDNFDVSRVQIDDLLLVGFMTHGTIHHALIAWYPQGVHRSTFNLLTLRSAGINWDYKDNCHITVTDLDGRNRDLYCTPGKTVTVAQFEHSQDTGAFPPPQINTIP